MHPCASPCTIVRCCGPVCVTAFNCASLSLCVVACHSLHPSTAICACGEKREPRKSRKNNRRTELASGFILVSQMKYRHVLAGIAGLCSLFMFPCCTCDVLNHHPQMLRATWLSGHKGHAPKLVASQSHALQKKLSVITHTAIPRNIVKKGVRRRYSCVCKLPFPHRDRAGMLGGIGRCWIVLYIWTGWTVLVSAVRC